MDPSKGRFTLITGASCGIGRSIARELAGRGYNQFLVALPGSGLREVCTAIEDDFGISAFCMELDLSDISNIELLRITLKEKGISPTILVNNVGVGYGGDIGLYSNDQILEMIKLNIVAATLLVNMFVSELQKNGTSYIVNMGSFGGFLPLPYKSIYGASKSYIYYFSRAISHELRSKGIKVAVVMPGAVPTNEVVKDRIKKLGFKGRLSSTDPDKLAIICSS